MPGAILCYHGCESQRSAAGGELHVLDNDLLRTVSLLRRWRRIVPLRDFVDRIRAGKSVSGLVALTFDDAYLSVAKNARSIIVDMRTPVTLFVVARNASNPQPYWWDRLDALVHTVPVERWRAFGDSVGFTDWNKRRAKSAADTIGSSLRDWIVCEHKGVLSEQLHREFMALERETGAKTQQRSLTWNELEEFRNEGVVDVGVHTLSHPALPLLDEKTIHEEILQGWEQLHARHADALRILAFPYGYHDERVVAAARECGMNHCLTTSHRTVSHKGDGFLLPRLMLSKTYTPFRVSLLASGLREFVRPSSVSADYSSRPPCA